MSHFDTPQSESDRADFPSPDTARLLNHACGGSEGRVLVMVGNMLRIGLFALALAGVATTAAAQERTHEGIEPSVMQNVSSDMLSNRQLREGDEVLRVSFPYERVGRLQNDLYRAGWTGRGDIVMRAGTPLYRTRYRYVMLSSEPGSDEVVHDINWPMWCGPTQTEAGRAVGHCIILRRGRAEIARIEGATLHSNELSSFAPVTMPQIADDARAERELAGAELVYRVRQVRSSHVGFSSTWKRAATRRPGIACAPRATMTASPRSPSTAATCTSEATAALCDSAWMTATCSASRKSAKPLRTTGRLPRRPSASAC